MACPECGCRTTYPSDPYFEDWDDGDNWLEHCARCGHMFDADEAIWGQEAYDAEDEYETPV